MRLGQTILLVGGGLIAWNLYSRTQAAKSLNFLPGQIKSFDYVNGYPVITIGLIVQNTSNHSFNLLSIAGNVKSVKDGTSYILGYVSDFTPQVIPPISETEIPLAIRLQLAGVLSDILTSLNAGFDQSISLQAYANVDQLQVPIDYNYKLT